MTTQNFKNRSLLGIFVRYFKPHLRLFLLDMLCAFTVSAIDLAFPLATRGALYQLLPDRKYQAFFVLMAIMVVCYVLRSVLQFVIAYWGHTFGIRVEADIRRDLYGIIHDHRRKGAGSGDGKPRHI